MQVYCKHRDHRSHPERVQHELLYPAEQAIVRKRASHDSEEQRQGARK
jgi:hypothetical protein